MGVLAGAGVRILLVGTGKHTAGSELPDLPTVAVTVADLATTVVERCGAQLGQVRTVVDPAHPLVLGRELTTVAAEAEDVLLVCYLGHGLLDARGELYLATEATDHLRDGLGYTALPYVTLQAELAKSRARSVIVLLDCCFSARATGSLYPVDLDGFASTRSSGGYLLASAAPEELALAPTGERYTAFSGELIRLLRDGDPAGPPELTLDHLYRCLDRLLPEQGRPRPRRYATGRTGELPLAPNPAYRPPVLARKAPAGADAVCPYRGLAAYDIADAQYFFGREALTERLVARMAEQLPDTGTLVVVGASGSGKSSLLRAGLIPVLEKEGLPNIRGSRSWPRVVFTPGSHPIATLANRLAALAGERADVLRARLAADPPALSAVADAVLSRHAGDENLTGRRLVLVVDQFEEVFTTCEDAQERQAFLNALTTAAASTALVVLGLRADFYPQCAAEPQLIEALQHSQLIVTPMSIDELRAAIAQPATQAGLTLEPGLVTLILRDLRSSDNTGHISGNGGLPFLSHALFETWQQRDGELLTLAGYEATGGIWEAVIRTAEDRYAKLTTAEQETAQLVLLRMVHVGEDGIENTRRRVRLADLPHTEAAARVLTTFADARLITLGTDTAEITHEALLRAWPRLRQWIGNLDRLELEEAAAVWVRDRRNTAELYRGSRLEVARAKANEIGLSPAASAFLAASTQQERRAARRRTRTLAALSTMLLVTTAASIFALHQRGTAQTQRDLAIFRGITAQADGLRSTDISLAAQLDLTAYRMRPTPDLYTTLITLGNAALSTPLRGHANAVKVVAFSPDDHTLATGSSDRTVRLWNVTDPTHPTPLGAPLTGHTDSVLSVAFSPDGHTLATGSSDRTVRLWNVTDPTHPTPLGAPLTGHTDSVLSVTFSPDGHTLATSSSDHTVRLWDLSDRDRPHPLGAPLTGHTSPVSAVAFSPDGHTLATSSYDQTVRLWNVTDPTHPTPLGAPLTGHTDSVLSVTFSPDGHTLATSSDDHTVRLWNVTDPTHPTPLIAPLTGHTSAVLSVTFSPDGHTLATSSDDHTVRLWNVTDPTHPTPLIAPLTGHTDSVLSVTFSPDGHTLATSSSDHTVRLWNIPSALITGHTSTVYSVVFSPDGHTLATGSDDHTVRLWDIRDPHRPTPLSALTGHTSTVISVTFSPDGHTLASGSSDGTVRLWDIHDPRQPTLLSTLTGHTSTVYSVAFSPDGHTLATGSSDHTVRLWDIRDPHRPTPLSALTGHTSTVISVTFSPDGHTLASGSSDGTVRLWDIHDPRQPTLLSTLTGHTSTVYSVAFSPDGHTLATGSSDYTVRLWDIRDPHRPTPLSALTGHTSGVGSVAFSPDGHTLATGSADRTVRLWNMTIDQAIQRICATTANTLTPAQWKQYVSSDLPYRPPCP